MKKNEEDLTRQWIASSHQAQASMERLGVLADRFRQKGWTGAAEELEEALRSITRTATT